MTVAEKIKTISSLRVVFIPISELVPDDGIRHGDNLNIHDASGELESSELVKTVYSWYNGFTTLRREHNTGQAPAVVLRLYEKVAECCEGWVYKEINKFSYFPKEINYDNLDQEMKKARR